jgi:hypothetical protein
MRVKPFASDHIGFKKVTNPDSISEIRITLFDTSYGVPPADSNVLEEYILSLIVYRAERGCGPDHLVTDQCPSLITMSPSKCANEPSRIAVLVAEAQDWVKNTSLSRVSTLLIAHQPAFVRYSVFCAKTKAALLDPAVVNSN